MSKSKITKKKSSPKPRAEKYEQKLVINGTFSEVIKVALNKQDEVKKARQAKEQDKPVK